MPSSLPSGLTFRQLQIQVAKDAGIASYINPDDENDNRARPPTDPNMLEDLKSRINEGYLRLFCAHPTEWTFFNQAFSLLLSTDGTGPYCLNSSPSSYALPLWIERINSDATYTDSLSPITACQFVDYDVLRRCRDGTTNTTGTPSMFSARRIAAPGGSQIGSRLVLDFWPAPSSAYSLEIPVAAQPIELVSDDDRPICGMIHDDAVFKAAKFAWFDGNDKEADPGKVASAKSDFTQALVKSIANDYLQRPARTGAMANTRRGRNMPNNARPPSTYTYNGVPIT